MRLTLATGMALLASCVFGEMEPPRGKGFGKVCLRELPSAVIHLPMEDGRFITPSGDGPLRCAEVLPGRVTVLLVPGEPDVADIWIDAGETTLLEAPHRLSASNAETERLARVVFAGRCAIGPSCSKDELSESLHTLSGALHSSSDRERQAARLVLASWPVPVDDLDVALAWDQMDVEPLLAAAYPSSIVKSAAAVGQPALDDLERICVELVGPAANWSAEVRAMMLLLLAEEGNDATRTRIRAEVVADESLRRATVAPRLLSQIPMTQGLEAESATLAANVVTSSEVAPCSPRTRWVLYFYSRQCPGCRVATGRLRDAVRRDPELGVIVVVDDPKTESPIEFARVVEIDAAMRDWFERSQGGLLTPYFLTLECRDGELEGTASQGALESLRGTDG